MPRAVLMTPPSRAIGMPLIALTGAPFIETSPAIAFNVPGRADPALGAAAAIAIEKIGTAKTSFKMSLRSVQRLQLQFISLP